MTVRELVSQMTLEEKSAMCQGLDMWRLKGVQRLSIPSVMVTDGPHGLRKQNVGGDHLGLGDSVPATAFPTAAALASSFDRSVAKRVGHAIGEECQKENVAVVLGPGANIKRSPLCGRNFEYFSEDPFLSGSMAAAHIQGVEEMGVGTSLKHFCLNNQETCRMSGNSVCDERTMREIYLATFELAVKNGKPWTVMCSYNRINGVFGCENEFTLTKVLRNDWGFDGYVMTDWGAMDDRIQAVKAGLELQMPGGNPLDDKKLMEAVQNGTLDEKVLDRAVERILNITLRAVEKHIENYDFSVEEHNQIAREAEADCMVLLKNEGVLPFKKGTKLAVIGAFAKEMRYQGGGSSHINAFKLTTALDAVEEYTKDYTYAQGFRLDGAEDEALLEEAVQAAKNAESVVIFAGLPDAFESEGFDRETLDMPENQRELIKAVCAANKNAAIVLANGAPIVMPWLNDAPAVLEGYLGGQAAGGAAMDVLFGKVNPSGRLAETFPLKLSHNPSYLNFGGTKDVNYVEGVFVGYRYYTTKDMDVLFPFGFGKSYTTFAYSNLTVSDKKFRADKAITVSVDVTNTGDVFGKEVVQLYVSPKHKGVVRPVRELKGFDKVALNPKETKTVTFTLDSRAFAYWEEALSDWHVEGGAYAIEIRKDANTLLLCETVEIEQIREIPMVYTMQSTIEDMMKNPVGRAFVENLMAQFAKSMGGSTDGLGMGDGGFMKMMGSAPLRTMVSFMHGAFTEEQAKQLVERMNA